MITKEKIQELWYGEAMKLGDEQDAYLPFARFILREVAREFCGDCREEKELIGKNDSFYHKSGQNFATCRAVLLHMNIQELEKP